MWVSPSVRGLGIARRMLVALTAEPAWTQMVPVPFVPDTFFGTAGLDGSAGAKSVDCGVRRWFKAYCRFHSKPSANRGVPSGDSQAPS